MTKFRLAVLLGTTSLLVMTTAASARIFDIPKGDLKGALDAYITQAGVPLVVVVDTVEGVHTQGAKGDLAPDIALARILRGTGFMVRRDTSGMLAVIPQPVGSRTYSYTPATPIRIAAAAATAGIESVVVTSSKIKGDIQTVPIAITALSQEQLTSRQIAGGPDLVKEVPNLTFTKTNFTGYSIQIRGIGTQAISVTTDPAVAVAFNDIPFIRNHFFEQEFYDVSQVEVLRGPQGTLYGRNATAGVVNIISAKPTDQFEAMASADWGNYANRRYEGMVNIPIVDERLGIRVAGEWTKRNGYAFNEATGKSIDGRDLWSSRVSLRFKPTDGLDANLVWEHFQESDDRARSTKQLCKKDVGPSIVDGLDISNLPFVGSGVNLTNQTEEFRALISQGCLPTSFYGADAFETPNGQANPLVALGEFITGTGRGTLLNQIDPYASVTQPANLRVIQSEISPTYHAKSDVFEFNADYNLTPSLTLTSQTGYNRDSIGSTEDFNRFNTTPGLFTNAFGYSPAQFLADPSAFGSYAPVTVNGIYCDPQLGCSSKMVGEDLSRADSSQINQEVRLASNFSGPLNFSLGGNFTRYQTREDYFVFLNLITAVEQFADSSLPGDFTHCYPQFHGGYRAYDYGTSNPGFVVPAVPFFQNFGFGPPQGTPSNFGCYSLMFSPGTYIDPNPITSLDGNGHNYFRSENPYLLNSYAGFGEVYYQVSPDLKLTGGLRWTDDNKRFVNIPSWVFLEGGGYPVAGVVVQQGKEFTGRFNATWTPKLDFTDQTMLYASYSRGYKGGGANPPGPQASYYSFASLATHPPTFRPEFVNAYEIGTKNTLLDGSLVLNGDVFYYDYKAYQISQIVDRTSINLNFDAKVKGAELESTWEPLPGLKFDFAGGFEASSVNKGQSAIDLMDRTDGNSNWLVVKPSVTDTSNCILPAYVMREVFQQVMAHPGTIDPYLFYNPCSDAYVHPVGVADPFNLESVYGITDFDPTTAPNGGAGFSKDLSGHQLPNAPHFTTSLSAEYTMPVSESWAATLHSDFYWQSQSFTRIFNDRPYDKLRGYSNVNLALILTSADGWQVTGYLKNVFDTTAITGAFLNSDDTWLTTNVFVTDPRLFGVRVTKNW